MGAIYKKEMLAYFTCPTGYVFSAVFFAISGIIFSITTFGMSSTATGTYFVLMLTSFIVLIPLLTMKLLSEERKSKTEQIKLLFLSKTLLFFFLLCFADYGKRKIAMAVSFGQSAFWNTDLYLKMRRYIQRFHAVSVREKQGVEICKKLYQKQAEFVLDPVFLVDRKFFLERARNGLFQKEEGKKKGKILLRYILDSNRFKRKVFHQLFLHLKKKGGTPIIRRPLPESSSRITLDDWLSGFQSADYILTDSFHGLCFSILFRKPFLVILNRARGADRFHSLLSLLHLEDRLIDESATHATISAILERPIRYQEAEEILAGMREKSIAWLKHHLEEELPQEESAPYTRESTLQEECSLYLEEREMLEDLFTRYRRSYSVQLGLFLTWLPRKLLSLVTGRKY